MCVCVCAAQTGKQCNLRHVTERERTTGGVGIAGKREQVKGCERGDKKEKIERMEKWEKGTSTKTEAITGRAMSPSFLLCAGLMGRRTEV